MSSKEYRAAANYISNECGINRGTVTAYLDKRIEEVVGNYIEQFLQSKYAINFLGRCIIKVLNNIDYSPYRYNEQTIQSYIKGVIQTEVHNHIVNETKVVLKER
jgi:hypothetical protein